jgi:hypothetical protein
LLPPLLGWLVSPPVTDDEPESELEDEDEDELAELDGVAPPSDVLVVLDVPG